MRINKLIFLLFPVLFLQSCKGGEPEKNLPDPYIESIVTDYEGKVVAGQPVTLLGLNFSPTLSDNKVLYGVGLDAVALRVNESSATHIVFTAPTVDKSQLKIRVSSCGKESNSVVLEYTQAVDPEKPWSDEPTIDFVALGGTKKTIVQGVEWTTFHGKWEGQIRNINIVRTRLDEHNHLGIYHSYYESSYPAGYPAAKEGEDPRDLDKKCIYMDAVVGTNGPMACCHFVRVNGEMRRAPVDTDPWTCNCAITIDGNDVDIVKVQDNYKGRRITNAANGQLDAPDNTLTVGCAGPLLVWEGKIQDYPEWNNEDFLKTTHPRTAIGISKDGKTVVQIAVDGRWSKSGWPADKTAIGMSTPLLSKLMLGLGCYKALNFDGGGGTAMWIYGQGNSRNIVNHVCENRWDWDGITLRPTGNAVYIVSDLKNK